MIYANHDGLALFLLRDILGKACSTGELVQRYGISPFSLQRFLQELDHLGVRVAARQEGSEQVWYCDNAEEVRSSALYRHWLQHAGDAPPAAGKSKVA